MFRIDVVGGKQLISKLEKLEDKIKNEPNRVVQRMADEGQYFAMMQAPVRTGALAMNIKRMGGRNWARLAQGPVLSSANNGNPVYPLLIDQGLVRPSWGTKKAPGMVDMRDRSEKLYYFVGTEGHKGKTLAYLEKNFPRHVDELRRRLDFR